jgi:hypothetical protein
MTIRVILPNQSIQYSPYFFKYPKLLCTSNKLNRGKGDRPVRLNPLLCVADLRKRWAARVPSPCPCWGRGVGKSTTPTSLRRGGPVRMEGETAESPAHSTQTPALHFPQSRYFYRYIFSSNICETF